MTKDYPYCSCQPIRQVVIRKDIHYRWVADVGDRYLVSNKDSHEEVLQALYKKYGNFDFGAFDVRNS